MIRSGHVNVWSLSWYDLQEQEKSFRESAIQRCAEAHTRRRCLVGVLAAPQFKQHRDDITGTPNQGFSG